MKSLGSLLYFPIFLFSLAGCSQGGSSDSATPTPSATPNPIFATYASINAQIIVPKCLQCHSDSNSSGGVDFSSLAGVLNTVNVGNPGLSSFYNDINSGTMPPSGPKLSDNEIQTVFAWIYAGADQNGNPNPEPTASSTPTQTNPNGTFTYLSSHVFQVSCIQCHSNYSTYSGVMASGDVVANSPTNSSLYLQTFDGLMPKNEPMLTNEQIQDIYDWINTGALHN